VKGARKIAKPARNDEEAVQQLHEDWKNTLSLRERLGKLVDMLQSGKQIGEDELRTVQ